MPQPPSDQGLRWCPQHERGWCPATDSPRPSTGAWRPLSRWQVTQAQRLAQESGCAGQIRVVEQPCDWCAAGRST